VVLNIPHKRCFLFCFWDIDGDTFGRSGSSHSAPACG
jgi:hypothetical protein